MPDEVLCSKIITKHSSVISFQTQRYIRVYDLTKQELLKKLQSSAKWISSMAIHPKGLVFSFWKIRQIKDGFYSSSPKHNLKLYDRTARICKIKLI